ncbi:hypothetical protein AK812_SmicGene9459 [Symbiodinium microadriaticum]|uniref:Uncharacterized protein n=1 Tax=Symbiodinium microadriaticum TaxID=2951 RepID=A0A1Q9EIC9_SYMMI|nr:hypothetical protein AK812_SmicGene9459 [Symbiodinium microadriaticum]
MWQVTVLRDARAYDRDVWPEDVAVQPSIHATSRFLYQLKGLEAREGKDFALALPRWVHPSNFQERGTGILLDTIVPGAIGPAPESFEQVIPKRNYLGAYGLSDETRKAELGATGQRGPSVATEGVAVQREPSQPWMLAQQLTQCMACRRQGEKCFDERRVVTKF